MYRDFFKVEGEIKLLGKNPISLKEGRQQELTRRVSP